VDRRHRRHRLEGSGSAAARSLLAALRQRADAAARPGARTPAEARALQAAVQAAACLDPALPNLATGMQTGRHRAPHRANWRRKSSAAPRATSSRPAPIAWRTTCPTPNKQAHVAAKACSYAGSEACGTSVSTARCAAVRTAQRWNAGQTACVPDKDTQVAQADCSRFPNTAARWSDEKGAVVCSCKSGWRPSPAAEPANPNRDAAVAAKQCPGAHARAYWDGSAGAAACGCAEGYKEDPTGGCEVDRAMRLAQTDCSAFANTEPYWDNEQQRPRCGLRAGYKLSAERRVCEPDARAQVAAVDCSRFANAEPYWDGSHQRASCRCREGHELNAQNRSCEAPRRSALAGWVGRWTCQFRAQARCTQRASRSPSRSARKGLACGSGAGRVKMGVVRGQAAPLPGLEPSEPLGARRDRPRQRPSRLIGEGLWMLFACTLAWALNWQVQRPTQPASALRRALRSCGSGR